MAAIFFSTGSMASWASLIAVSIARHVFSLAATASCFPNNSAAILSQASAKAFLPSSSLALASSSFAFLPASIAASMVVSRVVRLVDMPDVSDIPIVVALDSKAVILEASEETSQADNWVVISASFAWEVSRSAFVVIDATAAAWVLEEVNRPLSVDLSELPLLWSDSNSEFAELIWVSRAALCALISFSWFV